MKSIFTLLFILSFLYLPAQEKGVSPITDNLQPATGTTYAVVVGISDYQDEGIPDLRFADKDAEAFAAFLQSPTGGSVDQDHIKLLINEEATAAKFAIALDWIWEVAKENDRVIIYFSGHGDVERKSITQPGFLLCWDAPSKVYMAGGTLALPLFQEVISTLSLINKSKVVVITDACRSGKLSGSQINGNQLTNAHLQQRFANEIKILSCQPDEYSIEGEQWGGGRGAFSYHLLDGLYGLANSDDNQYVSLKEIGRYLEDHVTEEVAPQSQNPLIVGDKTEKLTDVFPEILAQVKEGKNTHLQIFKGTEAKGIEADVLASVDTSVVDMYMAFKQSLDDKRFFEPASHCAEFYYEQLSNEPQLELLHSNMRRNYAATLQDDAQQMINTLLNTGLTDCVLCGINEAKQYRSYPDYLARAAELLGEDHYMYSTLQARKHFFKAIIQEDKQIKRQFLLEALQWEADMPHAYIELIRTCDKEETDKAEYYAKQAHELLPYWGWPYINLSMYYDEVKDEPEKAEELLEKAINADTSSLLVYYYKGKFYKERKKYELAEKWFLKTIESTGTDICFPCAHNELGITYYNTQRFQEAETHYRKAIQLDSTFSKAYNNWGLSYNAQMRYKDAEPIFRKGLEYEPESIPTMNNLGKSLEGMGRLDEALALYQKVLSIDSTDQNGIGNLAEAYSKMGRTEEAIAILEQSIKRDSSIVMPFRSLGLIYLTTGQFKKAKGIYRKVLRIDSTDASLWVNLGIALSYLGEAEEMLEAYEQALKFPHPNAPPYAHQGLGIYYMRTGDFEKSEYHVNKLLEYWPNQSAPYSYLGQLYMQTGRMEKAKPYLEKAIEISPNEPTYMLAYCFYDMEIGQMDEAIKHFEEALKKGFNNYNYLTTAPELEAIRTHPNWNSIMKKYFPDQHKD